MQAHDLEEAEKGLWRGLRESGLVEGADFVVKRFNAQGEIGQLPAIVDAALAGQPDLVVTVTTPALIAAARKVTTVPLVFTVASEPGRLGLSPRAARPTSRASTTIRRWTNWSRWRTHTVPGWPSSAPCLIRPSPTSMISVEKLRDRLPRRHLTLQEASIADVSELGCAAQSLVQRGAQVIITSADNLVSTGFPVLARTARAAGVRFHQ